MIDEKGLCKILKSAYKNGGYTILPQTEEAKDGGTWRRNTIVINGATWAVRCLTVDLPKAAAVQIVEDAGYLPVEGIDVRKGAPNQLIMAEVAACRHALLNYTGDNVAKMKKIPVIFKERWQLYQNEEGEVYAFDVELLKLIDFKHSEPLCFMRRNGTMGLFFADVGDDAVYIARGRFSAEDQEKIQHIAALDWENQMEHDDPVANLSLLDPASDEAVIDREE